MWLFLTPPPHGHCSAYVNVIHFLLFKQINTSAARRHDQAWHFPLRPLAEGSHAGGKVYEGEMSLAVLSIKIDLKKKKCMEAAKKANDSTDKEPASDRDSQSR